jgi:hypothetical protein
MSHLHRARTSRLPMWKHGACWTATSRRASADSKAGPVRNIVVYGHILFRTYHSARNFGDFSVVPRCTCSARRRRRTRTHSRGLKKTAAFPAPPLSQVRFPPYLGPAPPSSCPTLVIPLSLSL